MSALELRPDFRLRRLARHREEMQLAVHEGLSLPEARRKLARARWAATLRRIAQRAATRAPAATAPAEEPVLQWWQR